MRIGILPNLDPTSGGVYQYSQTMLQALNTWSQNGCEDRFVLFTDGTEIRQPPILLRSDCWELTPLEIPQLGRKALDRMRWVVGEGPHREAWRWLRKRLARSRSGAQPMREFRDPEVVQERPDLRDRFLDSKVDLFVYPQPISISFETGVPYVIAIHDLQHRLQPEFPEVSANGEREHREYLFRNASRRATLILADSEVGKEDILNFYGSYGVTPDRVKVLPYLPAAYLAIDVSEAEQRSVRALYHLPDRYLFYPAQFWPHKNHARIVQALGLLKQQFHIEVSIVFCGSYNGDIRQNAYRNVISLASSLGVKDQIKYLGYVPDEHMSALYAGSVALVMPTFFGPTNIPVLEAWAFGCPVLTSDIRGIREQVGDAAVLVDPRSVESIAESIYCLWSDDALRSALIDAGCRRLSSYSPDDFRNRLIEILEEAKDRVRSKGIIVSGKVIHPHDIEKLVCTHPAVHDGRAVAFGLYNPELLTDDIIIVAETETDEGLKAAVEIERAVRNAIVAEQGVTPRAIYLKPPKWIVKSSTTGKPLRLSIREKLLIEQPELAGKEHDYLFEVVNDSVMTRTLEGRISFWNRRAEELYGWRKEEAIGKVSHKLLRTQFPRALEEIDSELVRNGRWEGKLVHATRDGGRVVVRSRWILNLKGQSGPVVEINTPSNDR
ncbi:MAG: glycosyltransferase [Alphaproteobacteria bacterium]